MTLQDLIDDCRARNIPLDKPIRFAAYALAIDGEMKKHVAAMRSHDLDTDDQVIFECEVQPGWGTSHVDVHLVPTGCE